MVQSLGLVYGENSIEIACILLEPNRVGVDRVQSQVEMLAAQEGLDVKQRQWEWVGKLICLSLAVVPPLAWSSAAAPGACIVAGLRLAKLKHEEGYQLPQGHK
ncbi:hypothetical protein V6N12_060402 [Hibiscus sabdariffa]|uniref:Uncharacterized protein n=1 Tax=Hibiscus sabdariffa TaxID=183260 RepID=A0ABR2D4B4_9ROSI